VAAQVRFYGGDALIHMRIDFMDNLAEGRTKGLLMIYGTMVKFTSQLSPDSADDIDGDDE
jgi:uncharacterized protein YbjQ (UPF0145 family)